MQGIEAGHVEVAGSGQSRRPSGRRGATSAESRRARQMRQENGSTNQAQRWEVGAGYGHQYGM